MTDQPGSKNIKAGRAFLARVRKNIRTRRERLRPKEFGEVRP